MAAWCRRGPRHPDPQRRPEGQHGICLQGIGVEGAVKAQDLPDADVVVAAGINAHIRVCVA